MQCPGVQGGEIQEGTVSRVWPLHEDQEERIRNGVLFVLAFRKSDSLKRQLCGIIRVLDNGGWVTEDK